MPSARENYLAKTSVGKFCMFLKDVIKGAPIKHGYDIGWKRWRKDCGKDGMKYKTVESAYRSYYWPTNSLAADDECESEQADGADGADEPSEPMSHDWKANSDRLRKLRIELSTSLEGTSVNEHKVFVAAFKVLDWGQVYKGSAGWLIQEYENGCLSKKLKRGAEILDGDEDDVTEFEGNRTLRMDFGLTKVYSLCSKHSIIYDDRVGAAMGLLVRMFLDQNTDLWFPNGQNKIPMELRFMRGPATTRNASVPKKYAFPAKKTGSDHARSNLWANWVIQKAVKDMGFWGHDASTDLASRMRALEGALFMLGYRVHASPEYG